MKVLMVNKFFFIKGGSERYYFELTKVLEKHGHTVIPFSMKHPNNNKSAYESYFVDFIDFDLDNPWEKLRNAIRITGRIVYSLHAKRKIEELIQETKPDIAHIHMIDHQISPSILTVLKRHGIPVIQTVHQQKLVCPSYLLYNMRTKQICEKCIGGSTLHPIVERCHKNSVFAGMLIGLESGIHRMMKLYDKSVDLFHVPSNFTGGKLEEGGFNRDKIEHLFYTIQVDDYRPYYESDNYFIYYGRLAEEKGIITLLHKITLR